jgi:acetyl-CoA C-acetyltransferase
VKENSNVGRKAVLVGVGQVRRNPKLDGPFVPVEPAEMMAEAVRSALADAGLHGLNTPQSLLDKVDLFSCVEPMAWAYDDLCGRTAELAGVRNKPEGLTVPPGGNSPGDLLLQIVNRIAEGELETVVLAGTECVYARRRAIKEGLSLDHWTPAPGHRDFLKGQRPLTNDIEKRHGLSAPIQCYPLYENALRAQAKRSIADHQHFLGTFMARNTAVAAKNPYAWFPTEYSAEQIATVTPENRWVCFPYPKRMNSIMEVDLAAAAIIMSEDEADRRAIPSANRVYVLGVGSAVDAWTPTERVDFTSSPGMRAASNAALTHAACTVDDIDLFDFYSCFPSAVQMATNELGIAADDPRGVTVTGGLAYAGGPGNSYTMHGIAVMTQRLRDPLDSAKTGLVSALGMTATKHAYAVLSSDPERVAKADGRGHKAKLSDEEVTGPNLVDGVSGDGVIETYTVEFGRDGEIVRTVMVVRFANGDRTVANGTASAEEIRALMETEGIGRRVHVVGGVAGEGDENVPNVATLLP